MSYRGQRELLDMDFKSFKLRERSLKNLAIPSILIYAPEWRNGIRATLKMLCPQGLEGSIPSSGKNRPDENRGGFAYASIFKRLDITCGQRISTFTTQGASHDIEPARSCPQKCRAARQGTSRALPMRLRTTAFKKRPMASVPD